MNWVVDRRHNVHVQACRHAGHKAQPYIPTSVRMEDDKPKQFAPKTYAEMREHLTRTDVKDKAHGPTILRPCDSCIPVEG